MENADPLRRRRRRGPAPLDADSLTTVDFLDALKARHQLTSDYQLAKLMRWPTQRISLYRTTGRQLDDDACVQVAHSLGAEPAYVLASIAGARAKREEIKQHWAAAARRLKARYGAAIAVAALATSQFAPPSPAGAAGGQVDKLYIMRPPGTGGRRRRRRRGERRIAHRARRGRLTERTLRRRRRRKESVIVAAAERSQAR